MAESKHLLKSKTFWLNVGALAVTAGSGGLAGLGLDLATHPKVALGLLAGGNILIRALTYGPVHLLDPFLHKDR